MDKAIETGNLVKRKSFLRFGFKTLLVAFGILAIVACMAGNAARQHSLEMATIDQITDEANSTVTRVKRGQSIPTRLLLS